MNTISRIIGKLGQHDRVARISEYDESAARLIDRTFRLIITSSISRATEYFSAMVVEGEYSFAFIMTSVLFLRQTRASKKYRDLEREKELITPTEQ